ncbi:hypothetical protein ACE6H2_018846 [Prunus campanulata]
MAHAKLMSYLCSPSKEDVSDDASRREAVVGAFERDFKEVNGEAWRKRGAEPELLDVEWGVDEGYPKTNSASGVTPSTAKNEGRNPSPTSKNVGDRVGKHLPSLSKPAGDRVGTRTGFKYHL